MGLTRLESDLDKLLGDTDMDLTVRNKRGVELHNRADRLREEFAKFDPGSRGYAGAKKRLLSITKRLLGEVFGITVDDEPTVDEPAAVSILDR